MTENTLSQQKLESYLWGCAEYLRNKIDAGDYKVYIFPLLFYKRISDIFQEKYESLLIETNDEKYAKNPINHTFEIPNGYHWNDLRKVSKNVGQQIQKSMQEIGKVNSNTLFDIFGDANWSYKERLSDETLINLIEHFSTENLSLARVPNDQMGDGYEFLIKKFADDSGHTAAEFYTNRTVVTLMANLLNPLPNESIYDPTCGTGGMLLECINFLKRNKKDSRTIKLYGQEKNLISSSIARMNMFLHGYIDASIIQGDTLEEPKFLNKDKLKKFDVILANPPYSIKKWNRKIWSQDKFSRNIYGTPPQAKADFAFIEHIACSLSDTGRAAILLPHGILFRDIESEIRENMIKDDIIECIIGLGPDLFYNSDMESIILVLKKNKKKDHKNKILLINADNEVERNNKKNELTSKNIENIMKIINDFKTVDGVSALIDNEQIKNNNFVLHIRDFIISTSILELRKTNLPIEKITSNWTQSSNQLKNSLREFKSKLGIEDNE
jgi:type I restriction enzyme M protein